MEEELHNDSTSPSEQKKANKSFKDLVQDFADWTCLGSFKNHYHVDSVIHVSYNRALLFMILLITIILLNFVDLLQW